MNRDFTVQVLDESMIVREGKMPHSRPMWKCDGVVWHVKGALSGIKYEQAANLVMNHAQGMRIYPSSIKRYSAGVTSGFKAISTETKRMKGF